MNVVLKHISTATCLIFAVFATGCATPDTVRVKAWQEIRAQEVAAEKARWDALAALGKDADPHTKDKLAMAWMAASMGGKAHDVTPMPAEPESAFDKTLRVVGILAPVAANITGNVMAYKLGTNQAQYSRDIALGDQASRVATVATVANGMASLGNSGLNAAVSLGTRPTTVVNGNGNAVNGSTADNSTTTTTNTNNCTSGQAGSSSGTTGSPAGGQSGQVPCTISK